MIKKIRQKISNWKIKKLGKELKNTEDGMLKANIEFEIDMLKQSLK